MTFRDISRTILVFSINLLIAFSAFTQSDAPEKNLRYKMIQGGIFVDRTLGNTAPLASNPSHTSASKITLGMIWKKNKSLTQTLLDASYFDNQIGSLLFIELEYFKSTLKEEILSHGFYGGYIASLSFSSENISSDFSGFRTSETCICIGAGFKAMYLIKIKDNLNLIVSSDVTLFDFGFSTFYNENPIAVEQNQNEFNFKVFRPRFGLDFGIAF